MISTTNDIEASHALTRGRYELALIIPLVILATAFFSPLLSYSFALLVLIIRTHEIGPLERKLLGFCIAFAGAIIISSRGIGGDGDDLGNFYYPIYLEITSGDFTNFFKWGWGVEIGLNVINTILALLLPVLTESGYAFALALISGAIFVFILEKYLLLECTQRKKATTAAVIYVMYSVYFSTQLSRQFFAGLLLIVALFEYRKSLAYIALLGSAVFHLSSLPLYLFYKAAGWFRLNRFYLFIPIAFGAYFLIQMMEPLLLLVSAGLPDTRLLYYAEEDASTTNLFAVKYLLIVLASVVAVLLVDMKRLTEREKIWISVYLVVLTFYMMTLNLKLFPTRAFLMIHGMLLGWFFVMLYRHLSLRACMVISFFVIAFYVQAKLFVDKSVSTALWVQFDRISVIPGYYMLHYFK